MQAIGLIETKGLIPAIESADVMLKTAQVELIDKSLVGGGLVTITVSGDVGAVKAAVDAGASAVLTFGQECLISNHVIARPHQEVGSVLFTAAEEQSAVQTTEITVAAPSSERTETIEDSKPLDVAEAVVPEKTTSEDYSDERLSKLSVRELRKMAEKKNVKLSAKVIQKANRATLIKHLREVENNQKDET